ncbi:YHS domain-containing (seleno)protein [Pedobacter gandavensis]|uniref:YHS domain-containing (seleno)protein n=1 Tax=Pedobacter gandavensis TaxID=2679963 RepID=UPI00292DB7E9|nr:YHS domain-containing (seleno)protein [Pedobacter gandavensis]
MRILLLAAWLCWFNTTESKAQRSEIFAPSGKAIKGFDAVAFFTEHMPVKGKDSLSFQWKGAQWLFSTRKNMEQFKSDPEHFVPQYGGYCAYGTAGGYKAPTKTETWTIVNDKLYFNYNNGVKENWIKNQDKLIEKADALWPTIKEKP